MKLSELSPDARAALEKKVVHALTVEELEYEEVCQQYELSKGAVYEIAVRHGARKHEKRIQERKAQTKERRLQFLQEVMNATTKCDVLEFLDGLPTGSVKLWVTSPPYNIGKAYTEGQADSYSFTFYLGFMLEVISEMARTTAEGGVMFLQVGSTYDQNGNLYPIDTLLFPHLHALGLTFMSRVVWCIPHGLTPKKRLAERYETALVFSKGPVATFNPNPIRTPQKQPGKRYFKSPKKGQLSGNSMGAWPSNVWHVNNVKHHHPEKQWGDGHPAQMPEEIAYRAIMAWTNAGDLIGDCFSGTGTTCAVAKRTGRAFIGADLLWEETRAKRLAAVAPDLVCDLPGVTEDSLAIWNAEVSKVHVPADPAIRQDSLAL